ncbi:hypothetical protein [Paracidovorax sp. MALMAid1276]|uniref:hypothetical protein n=1 Tax=Paracidovorax sp. MALMAid1276 TaxID=3411631 RepID=UPI003B9D9B55
MLFIRRLGPALAWLLACAAAGAQPQPQSPSQAAPAAPVLSSPVPPGVTAGTAGTAGTGAGHHSPNSPIAPLPQRNDVLPWSVLTDIKRKTTPNGILPVFNAQQQAMHNTVQRVQGFMMPMVPRGVQKHFLLTSVPLTCSFCIPGGPESMVEVKADTAVRYTLEPVVMEGRLMLLADDQYGLYYRMVNAQPVK